jgi:hypothetical protein
MMPWRRQPPEPGSEGEAPITPEDIAWRIGASDERPEPPPPAPTPDAVAASVDGGPAEPDAGVATATVSGSAPQRRGRQHAHRVAGAPTSRLQLWRDASALLFVVLLVAFLSQVFLSGTPPQTADLGSGAPSQGALGVTGSPSLITGPPTVGPAIDPSLLPGLVATPTPVATLAPGATPSPTPRVTPRPSPRPTPRVTPGPLPTGVPPTESPTATPEPTDAPTPSPDQSPSAAPMPEPEAFFDCDALPLSMEITCTDLSLHAQTYAWDFGDGGTSNARHPQHTYALPGTYLVTLTVANESGSDVATTSVTVPGT